ncbi:MAG: hypothetical protein ACR5K5_06160 [Wolbachia sp.]
MFFLVTRWNDKVSVRRCHPSTPFSSSQCLFLCHSSAQTTWIQKKEWCHASSPYDVIPVLDTGISFYSIMAVLL